MSQTSSSKMAEGTRIADEQPFPFEVCEETGERLFRAGEFAAAGEYVECDTRRRLCLAAPDFLPARLDGKVACYRLAQRGWEKATEPTLARRQAQFQLLVTQTHPRLYSFARRALGNSQDAEDVMQEAFARAWSHFEKFDARRPFEAWVFRIVNNLVIDQIRRRRRRQEISLDAPAAGQDRNESRYNVEVFNSAPDPQDRVLANEISAEVQSALRSLPPIYQATLLLIAQEHSYDQIARAFACPVGTVRSRLHRARSIMRRTLKERTRHE